MSTLLALPPELTHFLERAPPQSLVVRGAPGSGKTTLALAMLQGCPGRRVYVSSRVSRREAIAEFPWLDDPTRSRIQFIDATARPSSVRDAAQYLARAKELILDLEHDPVSRGLWLPGPLQEAFSLAAPDEATMIVVDSWDAIVESYLGTPSVSSDLPDRAEMERFALLQMNQAPVHTVLVLERETPSQLDYLVNGVLSVSVRTHDDRLERWLMFHKLRGTRINSSAYPFTLEGGRFLCITPIDPRIKARMLPPEPDPDPVPGFLWPGHAEFAANFGRLAYGRVTLVETDAEVPVEAIRTLLSPISAEMLRQDGHLFHVLPPFISPQEIWDVASSYVSLERFQRQVRIQTSTSLQSHETGVEPTVVPVPMTDEEHATTPRTPEGIRFLREVRDAGAPGLSFVWIDGLRAFASANGFRYTPENLPAIALHYISEAALHVLFIGNLDDPLTSSLRPMAHTRLTVRTKGGRVFVYGTRPETPPFLLSDGDATTPYHLLRIV